MTYQFQNPLNDGVFLTRTERQNPFMMRKKYYRFDPIFLTMLTGVVLAACIKRMPLNDEQPYMFRASETTIKALIYWSYFFSAAAVYFKSYSLYNHKFFCGKQYAYDLLGWSRSWSRAKKNYYGIVDEYTKKSLKIQLLPTFMTTVGIFVSKVLCLETFVFACCYLIGSFGAFTYAVFLSHLKVWGLMFGV